MATLDKATKQWMSAFGEAVVARAIKNLEKKDKVVTGRLRDSLTYKIKSSKGSYDLVFTTKDKKTKAYADVVEKGRRKGARQPPPEPIMDWLKARKIPLYDAEGNIMRRTEKRLRSVAWIISRSIKKKGIKGIFYFERALQAELKKQSDDYLAILNEYVNTKIALKKYNKK